MDLVKKPKDSNQLPISVIGAIVEEVMNDAERPQFTFRGCTQEYDKPGIFTVTVTIKDKKGNDIPCTHTSGPGEDGADYLKVAIFAIAEQVKKMTTGDTPCNPYVHTCVVRGISHGTSDYALATVVVQNKDAKHQIEVGYGVDQSVIHASVRAYISAINKLLEPVETPASPWKCNHVESIDSGAGRATATVTLSFLKKKPKTKKAKGNGHIDAAFKAVNAIIKAQGPYVKVKLTSYDVYGGNYEEDTQCGTYIVQARIRSEKTKEQKTGRASGPDLVKVSVEAYLSAINQCLAPPVVPSPKQHKPTTGKG